MNDQDQLSFDPRIADWLEADANEAPDQALQVVLAAFPSIRQRHGAGLPRRFFPMSNPFKLALGAVALAAVVLGGAYILRPAGPNGGVGGPSATPSAIPTPSSAQAQPTVPVTWTTHTSSRFAYTIDYPADWVRTPATMDWPATGFPDIINHFDRDAFGPPYFGSQVLVSSIPLTAGRTAADWLVALDREGSDADCQWSSTRTIKVDGVDARRTEGVCMSTDQMIEIAVANDKRFYLINMFGTPSGPFTDVNHATLDKFLASFKFDG